MRIKALTPVFAASSTDQCFHTTLEGQHNLTQLGIHLTGKDHDRDGLVGIYVTESAERKYNDDPAQFGRVIALVRMLPMPAGKSVQSYPSGCMDRFYRGQLVDRWPVGWPSETVFYSEHGGPFLRDAVANVLREFDYASFAQQFLQGPIDIRQMRGPDGTLLSDYLMNEIRNQVRLNPNTQVRPF